MDCFYYLSSEEKMISFPRLAYNSGFLCKFALHCRFIPREGIQIGRINIAIMHI